MTKPSSIADFLPADEYLARERAGNRRHEYVAGHVYSMSPVSKRHSTIAFNISRRLFDAARAHSCELYQDVLVRVARERYYYPDVVIACDPRDADEDVVLAPCFVVEVTSPGTRATDLREKVAAFLANPSIQGYLIAEQKRRRAIMYRRESEAEWSRRELARGDSFAVPCIHASLGLDEMYDGVQMPPMRVGEDEYTLDEYEREYARLEALGFVEPGMDSTRSRHR